MTPLETVLSRLPDARRAGKGWSARCPAHADRRSSLNVSEGNNGAALIKCHAGCDTRAVLGAIGLTLRDLFPAAPGRNGHAGATSNGKHHATNGRAFATLDEAIASLERQLGPRAALWTYHDAGGEVVGAVGRWDTANGKEIRPFRKAIDGWHLGAMPDPRPLYGLPDLAGTGPVLALEGEKCADAARSLGFAATTSPGGAAAAAKTDWSPLANRHIIICPDNDPAGRRYAEDVRRLVLAAGAESVSRIDLARHWPDCPPGGDLADLLICESPPWGDAAGADDIRGIIGSWAEPWTGDAAGASAGAAGGPPRPKPDLVCLADVEARKVPWLWPGRIPFGRLTLLVGRPGVGKSFLISDLAARVSAGAPWPDCPLDRAPAGDVLLISAEDDPGDTIRPRLDAAGADCRRVHLLRAAKVVGPDGAERSVAFALANVDLIRDALDRLDGCKLVVVDPIGSYLGGRTDINRDNEVRSVLAPLAALAAERGAAVALVCHTRKALAGFADDAVLGSRGFTGLARSVLHLAADPVDEKRKLLLPGKCNLSAPAPGLAFRIAGYPPRLEWEPTPVEGYRADDLVTGGPSGSKPGPEPEAQAVAVAWLREALAGGPRPAQELADDWAGQGGSERTLRRARQKLGVVTFRPGPCGPWWWRLP